MKIKEENYRLKLELNDFKKRNEFMEINVQQMQNNVINENQKFQTLGSSHHYTLEVKLS